MWEAQRRTMAVERRCLIVDALLLMQMILSVTDAHERDKRQKRPHHSVTPSPPASPPQELRDEEKGLDKPNRPPFSGLMSPVSVVLRASVSPFVSAPDLPICNAFSLLPPPLYDSNPLGLTKNGLSSRSAHMHFGICMIAIQWLWPLWKNCRTLRHMHTRTCVHVWSAL